MQLFLHLCRHTYRHSGVAAALKAAAVPAVCCYHYLFGMITTTHAVFFCKLIHAGCCKRSTNRMNDVLENVLDNKHLYSRVSRVQRPGADTVLIRQALLIDVFVRRACMHYKKR